MVYQDQCLETIVSEAGAQVGETNQLCHIRRAGSRAAYSRRAFSKYKFRDKRGTQSLVALPTEHAIRRAFYIL